MGQVFFLNITWPTRANFFYLAHEGQFFLTWPIYEGQFFYLAHELRAKNVYQASLLPPSA